MTPWHIPGIIDTLFEFGICFGGGLETWVQRLPPTSPHHWEAVRNLLRGV